MSKLTTLLTFYRTPKKFSSRKKLLRIQEKRMLKHVKEIRKKSKFFSRLWEDYDDTDWKNFPIIDKEMMMSNLQDYLTEDLDVEFAREIALNAEKSRDFTRKLDGYSVGFSSGTTGARGMHIVSKYEQDKWSGYMMSRGLDGSIFGRHNIGLFLRANSNTYENVGSRNIKFHFFDLMQPMDELVEKLLTTDLDILIAPPSVLRYLADIGVEVNLRRIVSSAEVLTQVDKKVIEQHFGQIVHQFYSSTEGEIAATCEFGNLHLNEEIMVIQKEWVDEERGVFRPIISDFVRITQPIIRYRQNDLLVLGKEPCACGDVREHISEVIGRQDDMFLLQKKSGDLEHVVPDLIRRATLQMSNKIESYFVEQISEDEINVMIQPKIEDLDMSGFNQLWTSKSLKPPKLNFLEYEYQPSAIKMRRISRRF